MKESRKLVGALVIVMAYVLLFTGGVRGDNEMTPQPTEPAASYRELRVDIVDSTVDVHVTVMVQSDMPAYEKVEPFSTQKLHSGCMLVFFDMEQGRMSLVTDPCGVKVIGLLEYKPVVAGVDGENPLVMFMSKQWYLVNEENQAYPVDDWQADYALSQLEQEWLLNPPDCSRGI